jgi:hypothetical protein
LQNLRATIIDAFPEHTSANFSLLTAGWDSFAVDVNDRLIFKFPRHAAAETRLKTEARLLAVVRPAVTMRVPDLALHPGPPLFSLHAKLPGEHLLAEHYERLPIEARQRLAADMAVFYAELHRLDPRRLEAAGAGPIGLWLPPDEILRLAWPLLPLELQNYAERTIAAWERMAGDPHGTTYGFFDGHGWNMAFDHAAGRLNGIYDFGDSGFGPLHHEFIHINWISPDLAERVIAEYETLTGRELDRERIKLITGVLRLSELGGFANDTARVAKAVRTVAEWAAYQQGSSNR